jgi:hypothetical protein
VVADMTRFGIIKAPSSQGGNPSRIGQPVSVNICLRQNRRETRVHFKP